MWNYFYGKGSIDRRLLSHGATNRDPDSQVQRTLVYIPIIHTQADMGSLSESLQHMIVGKFGKTVLKRKVNAVERIWSEIERVIEDLALAYENVRLYQDGLPVCGRETQIVTELANTGSRNHKLLLRLIERGATLMGTESAELLVEEYELSKKTITPGNARKGVTRNHLQQALFDSLLRRRDQFIAHRINDTLCSGETGILFVGMAHSLGNKLSGDIDVVYPLSQPFRQGGRRP